MMGTGRVACLFFSLVYISSSFLHMGLVTAEASIGEGLRQDAEALVAFKSQIGNDPSGALREWGTHTNPCQWRGVQCATGDARTVEKREEQIELWGLEENRVVNLELWDLELEGSLSSQIGSLSELRSLVIVGNNFSGEHIPNEIRNCRKLNKLDLSSNQLSGDISFRLVDFPRLESLSLSENQLTGTLDFLFSDDRENRDSVIADRSFNGMGTGQCSRLGLLDLAGNLLSGKLPQGIGRCKKLHELSLNENRFNGSIPHSLSAIPLLNILLLNGNRLDGKLPSSIPARCKNLQVLNVADNFLGGHIPVEFAEFEEAQDFNFSNNVLEGPIPVGKWRVQEMFIAGSFSMNAGLCGWPLTRKCKTATALNYHSLQQHWSQFISKTRATVIRVYNKSGATVVTNYTNVMHKMRLTLGKLRQRGTAGLMMALPTRRFMGEKGESPSAAPAPSSPSVSHGKGYTAKRWVWGLALGIVGGALTSSLLAAIVRLLVFYFRKTPHTQGPIIFHPNITPKMLVFLEKDESLSEEELVGVGGAGRVYRAELENQMVVAVKRVPVKEDQQGLFGQRQIRAELETLGSIRHRNLVVLLAYVHRPQCHLLMYEYMENGSLHHTLQKADSSDLELPWPLRHKIAVGTAQGLSYLHFHSSPKIVHRDLKPSNILLDANFTAHVSDFGLAKVVPGEDTHVSTGVAGTVGYIAPEYSQTCRFTDKSDVYSFGVVLAVLLTGKDPTSQFFHTVPGGSMGSWLQDLLQNGEIKDAIDPKLKDEQYEEEILLAMKISVFCTSANPKERPSSKEVLIMLNQIRSEEP